MEKEIRYHGTLKEREEKWVLFFIFFLFLAFFTYHLTFPLLDKHSFRQTQTAMVARNFFRHGINPLRPELDMFGRGKERFLLLEFPLYQMAIASIYHISGVDERWGRLISILMGYLGAFFLYKLVRLLTESRPLAYSTAFFYLATPLNLYYFRAFMMESTVVGLCLMGLYFLTRGVVEKREKYWWIGLGIMTLAFVHKGTYGPFYIIPVLFLVFSRKESPSKKWKWILTLGIPFLFLFIWQGYTQIVNQNWGHGYFSLRDPLYRTWNFGVWRDRILWSMWKPRLGRIFKDVLTPAGFILSIFGLFTLGRIKRSAFFYIWGISELAYFLILFRIQSHNYYQIIITPLSSLFIAQGVLFIKETTSGLFGLKNKDIFSTKLKTAVKNGGLILLALSWVFYSFHFSLRFFNINTRQQEIAQFIELTTPHDAVLAVVFPHYDWNPVYLYYADRKGVHLGAKEIEGKKVMDLVKKKIEYLVLVDFPGYLGDILQYYQVIGEYNRIITMKLKEPPSKKSL